MISKNFYILSIFIAFNSQVDVNASSSNNVPGAHAQSINKAKPNALRDVTYTCSNEYIKSEKIKILWSESNYSLPISVLDGFNSETCIGKVTKNSFTWDRGTSHASLDRQTGALMIKPKKDGISISLKCAVVD